ncbi:MAG: PEGA domain-containing protein, partial [Myxococcales bacterium]|nr:PEGA domain-containing protein [Myxococcales bacterium]
PQPAALPPIPTALPPEQAQRLQRDPTLQISITRKRQGLTILASVTGTLALVGGLALVLLNKENPAQNSSATSHEATKPAPPTTTGDSSAKAPEVETSTPITPLSALPISTTQTPLAPTTIGPTAKSVPEKTAPERTIPEKTTSTGDKTDKNPSSAGGGGNGFLTVVCKPACDSVIVKGRNLGPSPVVNMAFPAGTYPVVLKRSGSPTKSSSVTIVAGKNTPLRVEM